MSLGQKKGFSSSRAGTKIGQMVSTNKHGSGRHGRHTRHHARQERLDLSKSGITLNSRSHADIVSVTQIVSTFEFISIDEMILGWAHCASVQRCAVTPPPTHMLASVPTAQRCALCCQQCLSYGKPALRVGIPNYAPESPHAAHKCSLSPALLKSRRTYQSCHSPCAPRR